MADSRHLEIAISEQPFALDNIWHNDASGPSALDWPLKFMEFENSRLRMDAILHNKKSHLHNCLTNFDILK